MAIIKKHLGSMIGAAFTLGILPLTIAAQPAVAANLVTNGSFEQPQIPSGSIVILPSIPGWNLLPGSQGTGIEIQNNVAGSPFQGQQFVELDSNGVTGIFQDLATQVGETYRLEFAFSPRPGVRQNILNINWGGQSLGTLSTSGVALNNTNWTVFSTDLLATSPITRLSFNNFNELSNSVGTYLDAVSVTAVPEPASLLGLLGIAAVTATATLKRKQQTAKAKA
ncbi:MAG TPA: PEP-CTERM sorting domain-containing protein [Nostocaceae cyanobacterium]|nr:PEP-CTERM sorting domain-containing protein [Nostocaceae cyanobacterium]